MSKQQAAQASQQDNVKDKSPARTFEVLETRNLYQIRTETDNGNQTFHVNEIKVSTSSLRQVEFLATPASNMYCIKDMATFPNFPRQQLCKP
eukprot:6492583-Amphidinium_carterae.3